MKPYVEKIWWNNSLVPLKGLVGKGREIVKVADWSPKISLAGIARKRDTLLMIAINPKIKNK